MDEIQFAEQYVQHHAEPRPSRGFRHPLASIGGPPEHTSFMRDFYDPTKERPERMRCIPPDIHPTAIIHAFVTVDAGMFRATAIGEDTFVMAHAHVGHDVVIGARCDIATGCILGGETTIGDDVKMGLNCTTRPQVTIGDGARVGAGSVVLYDIPAGECWAGNPARRLESGREAKARGHADRRVI